MEETTVELGGLRTVWVGAPADAAFVLALLHGFMMVPGDLSPFARSIGLPGWFLYPEGPVSAPPGRAWWHIDPSQREAALARGPRDFAAQNPPNLPAARRLLSSFLDAVVAIAGPLPLIVGGFSQGGCSSATRSFVPSGASTASSSCPRRASRARIGPLTSRRDAFAAFQLSSVTARPTPTSRSLRERLCVTRSSRGGPRSSGFRSRRATRSRSLSGVAFGNSSKLGSRPRDRPPLETVALSPLDLEQHDAISSLCRSR